MNTLIVCCIMTGLSWTVYTECSVKSFTTGSTQSDTFALRRVDLRAALDTARADFVKCALAVKVLRVSLDSVLKANAELVDKCNRSDNRVWLELLIGVLILVFLYSILF